MSGSAPRRRPSPRHRRRVHPIVISLVAIFAVVFVTLYAFNQGLPFVHRYTLYALVNNSVNVRADSPVRIAGIDVGAVQGVSPAGRASKIAFTLDQAGLPVHTDATMRIRDRLFLEGGYYLELDPGSPGAPIAPEGFEIPISQTSSPVQFYNVLSTFNAASRSSLERLLRTLNQGFSPGPGQSTSTSGAGGLKTAIPQFTPVLKDIAWVTRALQGTRPGDVRTLLSSASDITSTLAAKSTQLADLVTGLNVTAGALASSDGALAQTISGLDQTLQAAPASLVAIDRALPPVARLAQTLDPSLKLAPPIVTRVTQAVQELARIVAPAERARLLSTLKATFSQFPSILRLLAATFPITKQVTDCLRTHVTPIFNQQVPDGSLSTGRPVWQDFVHFLPNIAGASGNFDANGPYVRVLTGAGTNSLSGGVLGSIPLLGQIVGASPPGGSSLLGARPSWVGTLRPADFRPDAKCATQKLPSLVSPAAASDLRAARGTSPSPVSRPQLQRSLARAARQSKAVSGP
ncbi:MAG: phospholipid/cholesterol/gamma-HCH transport system substrate-binding protein [Solirubrobacteraceae bacterium]|nr:phospholipid/cholesterol/gamma-HCH transport system substrate-binding protein [Solirubrobacteraceae bacterium]